MWLCKHGVGVSWNILRFSPCPVQDFIQCFGWGFHIEIGVVVMPKYLIRRGERLDVLVVFEYETGWTDESMRFTNYDEAVAWIAAHEGDN